MNAKHSHTRYLNGHFTIFIKSKTAFFPPEDNSVTPEGVLQLGFSGSEHPVVNCWF